MNIDPGQMIHTPWDAGQVARLNEFQTGGYFHPFMCGFHDEHPSNNGILVAHRDGWTCPAPECHFTQDWAHAFMADGEWLEDARRYHEELFTIGKADRAYAAQSRAEHGGEMDPGS